MKRIAFIFFTLFFISQQFFAQELETSVIEPEGETIANPQEQESSEEQPDSEESTYVYKMNQKGDQFINISLMMNIPIKPALPQLKIGGSGAIGFTRFINSYLAVGGYASFVYSRTIGENVYTFVPLMAKIMYQPTVNNFEFPLSFGLGGSFQTYIGEKYFGLTLKPEVGAFYRYSPSWSFGVNAGMYILPQWCNDSTKNRVGLISDVAIVARYHF
ncbi:MAG: hypothetical protein E7063_01460 [Spirochaetaceae bacterium]|nr:hypothetical protein [Spirochaetaceae bacterium]